MADATQQQKPTYCFLDTNILIHGQTFDQPDWAALLGAREVCLVVAPVVLKELDRHKNENKHEWVRERARAILTKLKPHLRAQRGCTGIPVQVRPQVALLFVTNEPLVEWGRLGLDQGWNDDRLIASILEFTAHHPGTDIRLLAYDTSLLGKAMAQGIQLVDEERIPEQSRSSSEQAEVEKLRRQVQELTNRIPTLEFSFWDGEDLTFNVVYPRQPARGGWNSDDEIAQLLATDRAEFDAILAQGQGRVPEKALGEYRQQCEKYLRMREIALPMQRSRDTGPMCRLTFAITNTGRVPATDVQVDLTLPAGSFTMPTTGDTGLWDQVVMPKKPKADWMKPPPGPYAGLAYTPSLAGLVPRYPAPIQPPKPRGPLLDLVGDRRHVQYASPKVVQDGTWTMDPVVVYLPPATGDGFLIEYALRADELPKWQAGQLSVKWQPLRIATGSS